MKDLSLQFFGRLFAIEPTRKVNRAWMWWCHCECGEFVEVLGTNLTRGHTKSCGCLHKEELSQASRKHGDSKSSNSPYYAWRGMRSRCSNSHTTKFKWYGGKGIQVCDEWNNYSKFKAWALANGWEKGLTIDRIDSSKNYTPDNCRWVTQAENSKHQFDA